MLAKLARLVLASWRGKEQNVVKLLVERAAIHDNWDMKKTPRDERGAD
jgi:hypothetical protein